MDKIVNDRYVIALIALFCLQGVLQASGPVRSEHVEAELVSEQAEIRAGEEFWVGLRLVHDPHWHTYWLNPGDSGLETMLTWDLPEGFSAGEIHWPYPERIEMGPLVTYAYERDVVLMVPIQAPAQLDGEEITLHVRADWLECKEICLPGSAELSLTLPVTDQAPQPHPSFAEHFQQARQEWPLRDTGWRFEGERIDDEFTIRAIPPESGAPAVDSAQFFAAEAEMIQYYPAQHWQPENGSYVFTLVRDITFRHEPNRLTGVLVSEDGWLEDQPGRALFVDVAIETGTAPIAAPLAGGPDEISGLAAALFFAFLGGIILNLMPCVFPVISIKIMGFVRQAEEERGHILKHGLLFGLGVLVSFWILAGALIALRAGGEQLGWGFHLQSPVFLMGMSVLFFLLALNLFGVFEVGTSWMGIGQKATGSSTWTGSFFSGALATVIATPCTAPFMGAALGYALTLSAIESLLIFSALGAGMAAPYVLLSAYPQWLRKIPKPGPWMETLKQSMGWLLAATVVWLAWVLNIMGGGEAVILLLGVLFIVGFGSWILGRWGALSRGFPVRLTAKIIAALLIFGGAVVGIGAASQLEPAAGQGAASTSGMPWEDFTPERLEELRAEGQPVFVNFTAAWCLSCLANERVAFSSSRVQAAFREKGITPLKADWTNRDDVIGGVLAEYGRSSVPFYVLYGADHEGAPITLPEILTPGIVLEALEEI